MIFEVTENEFKRNFGHIEQISLKAPNSLFTVNQR